MTADIDMKSGDALLIVDLQNDFCPGGALPLDEGDQIVPVVNEWIKRAVAVGIPVYASRDWHPREHLSFKAEGGKWPPHCIQDSSGAAFHDKLILPAGTIVVTKGVRFDKDQNSAFDATGLAANLKQKRIQRLFICGLALDVCVLATIMDALRLGFNAVLIADATRPVAQDSGDAAVDKMMRAGAVIIARKDRKGNAEKESGIDPDRQELKELPICTKAPEWAEHQRLTDSDEPCDDGRAGKS